MAGSLDMGVRQEMSAVNPCWVTLYVLESPLYDRFPIPGYGEESDGNVEMMPAGYMPPKGLRHWSPSQYSTNEGSSHHLPVEILLIYAEP